MRKQTIDILLMITLVLAGAFFPARASGFVSKPLSAKIRHFTEDDGLPQGIVTCVVQDAKGYVWVSSWNGLSRYDGYTFTNFKAKPGDNSPLASNRISFIREAEGGNILCRGTGGFYLFKTAEKKFVALKDKKTDNGDRYRPGREQTALVASLPEYKGREIHILYKDRQGGYWIFSHRGLDRLTFSESKLSPVKSCAAGEEFIRTIFRDSKNRLFIGDKNGFLRIYSPNGTLDGYITNGGRISKNMTPFGANVYSMFQDSEGYLWLGTKPGGLFRMKDAENGGFTVRHFMQAGSAGSINCNSVYSVKEDGKGRILVGTYGGGLNIIEDAWGETPHFVNASNGMPQYPESALFIHDIMVARDGTLLLATRKGLFASSLRHPPRRMTFARYKRMSADSTSLSENQIMALLQSRDGTVYVATYGGGLNIVSKSSSFEKNIGFIARYTENGMASDVVLNMCEDKEGMIWLVSEHSLMKYDPVKNTFANYSGGLFSGDFSFSEACPLYNAADGTMLFGTTQGVLTINVNDFAKSSYKPNIVFDTPDCINLSPEEHNFTVAFAAIDLNKNEPIRYAYMFEGVDDRWLYTTENRINLTNIPAGTHRLRVKSTNGDGVWMDNEKCVTVHRTPYFNERPVAWMLYGALSLIAIVLAFRTYRYIRVLEREIHDLKLSNDEKMEYLRMKLGDIVSRPNTAEGVENGDSIERTDFRDKVQRIVSEHLADTDYNVNTLAGDMFMSRSTLYVAMKKEMGCTPNNYILGVRLNEAYTMLKDERQLSVSEVAYRCGFSDPKYFSRCFKKAFAVTPSEIRSEA